MSELTPTSETLFTTRMLAAAATATINLSADRAEWDRRMAEYLRCDALHRADSAFGALSQADERRLRTSTALEITYGRGWKEEPAAKAERDAAWATFRAAEERHEATFLLPLWEAMRNLVLTHAPDLAAALFKVELIDREEVWNDARMTRDAMEIVREDMDRLLPTGR